MAIVAGRDHTCARNGSGALLCWGSNFDRELTSACVSTSRCTRPVQVSGLPAQALDVWDQPVLSSVFQVSFNVSDADRVPGKANATITFAFTPQTLVESGSVTLNYPPGFLAADVTPSSAVSNVAALSLTVGSTTSTSLVLIASGSIPTSSQVVVTVHGVSMGDATEGVSDGVSVQTSADVAVSLAVSSGAIRGRVTSVAFHIATADRIAGNANATVTLTFTPYSAVLDQQFITLNYPHAFLAPGVVPFLASSSTAYTADNFVFYSTSNSSVVFQLNAASLSAASQYMVAIGGLTVGAATTGSPTGITVQTSSDTGRSVPVNSGSIFMSLTPVAVSAFPTSPFLGETLTVSGHSFILPDIQFVCTAVIVVHTAPSSAIPATCTLLSESQAVVQLPQHALIAPSRVQLHFEPGNVTTSAATPLCPCSRAAGGTPAPSPTVFL